LEPTPGEGAAELIRKLDFFVHRNAEKKTKPTPLLHFPSKPEHFLLCNEKAFHVQKTESRFALQRNERASRREMALSWARGPGGGRRGLDALGGCVLNAPLTVAPAAALDGPFRGCLRGFSKTRGQERGQPGELQGRAESRVRWLDRR
jgi:hypothetical protein